MLRPAHEWVFMGPGSAKNELAKHVETHDSEFRPRIVGVATVDHPTDGQIVAQARSLFKAADRMRPA
ncbi:MAG: hypothetical protein Q7T86_17220 [Hyphomicrobiaceae bacterium]|nr:hypothetical protein [Hyphomicrobiaceae bacterium]